MLGGDVHPAVVTSEGQNLHIPEGGCSLNVPSQTHVDMASSSGPCLHQPETDEKTKHLTNSDANSSAKTVPASCDCDATSSVAKEQTTAEIKHTTSAEEGKPHDTRAQATPAQEGVAAQAFGNDKHASARIGDIKEASHTSMETNTTTGNLTAHDVKPATNIEENKLKAEAKQTPGSKQALETASARTRAYLLAQKAKRSNLLPPGPPDMEDVKYVSAEEQQPAKKRGRKPKTSEEGAASKQQRVKRSGSKQAKLRKAASKHIKIKKAKSKQAKDNKAASKRTQKGGRKRKNRKNHVVEEEEEEDDTPFSIAAAAAAAACRSAAEAKMLSATAAAGSDYTPMELPDDANAFDAQALDAAATNLRELDLSKPGVKGRKRKTKKRGKTNQCSEGAAAASVVAKARENVTAEHECAEQKAGKRTCPKEPRVRKRAKTNKKLVTKAKPEETMQGAKKPAKDAETKKRNSRKSCAYQKILRQQMKAGVSEEQAKVAARKVSVIIYGTTFPFIYLVKFKLTQFLACARLPLKWL